LTGAKVAQAMLEHQWRPFGIPSIITTDQGSHFVNSWWQHMCAVLGVRHAVSHAYHHRANGRAERAGQQVIEKCRSFQIEEGITWVEALPRVLDRIHDTPGETGFSPYEILFGRQRPLANLPYEPPRECEDAKEFFKRMARMDQEVADRLNKEHEKEEA
jgi:transposase InsO family protein